jgi:hypothetical protein
MYGRLIWPRAKIHPIAEQMLATLKEQITSLPTNEYIAAHKFLESLAYWARE